jgi:hypothetical protein
MGAGETRDNELQALVAKVSNFMGRKEFSNIYSYFIMTSLASK